jgi:hypothetical protein
MAIQSVNLRSCIPSKDESASIYAKGIDNKYYKLEISFLDNNLTDRHVFAIEVLGWFEHTSTFYG